MEKIRLLFFMPMIYQCFGILFMVHLSVFIGLSQNYIHITSDSGQFSERVWEGSCTVQCQQSAEVQDQPRYVHEYSHNMLHNVSHCHRLVWHKVVACQIESSAFYAIYKVLPVWPIFLWFKSQICKLSDQMFDIIFQLL